MKKIIFKKLSNEIFVFFLICGLALSLIIWVIKAVNYLDIVTEDGHSFGVYFNYTLFSLPKIFSQLLPFTFFISTFYIIILFEEKNQLLVYWTHGVTKKEFINSVIKLSLYFLILQLFFTLILVPYSSDKSRSFIRTSTMDFFPSLIKPKKFIDTVERLTIFIDSTNSEGVHKNIIIKDSTNGDNIQIIFAQTGKVVSIENEKILILSKGQIIQANAKKETTTFNFEETQFNLNKYSTKTTTYPKIQELETLLIIRCANFLRKNARMYSDIYGPLQILNLKNVRCDIEILDDLVQELFKRIFLPFYIILMALTSSSLVLRSKVAPHYSIFKIIIFLIGLSFLIIPEVLLNFTGINYLNNLLFFLIPIFSYIIIYQVISSKVRIN